MTWQQILLKPVEHPILTITFMFVVFRLFRPMKSSDGRKSNTLTGLFCVTLVIFMVVIIDSLNDTPQVSSQSNVTSTAKGTKVSRRRRGGTSYKAAKSRTVVKEKYGILMILWIGFACLYLLSHRGKEMQIMGLRFMTALRGKFNPLPGEEPIDRYIVESLERDDNPENREWSLRMVLAKQGVLTGSLAPSKTSVEGSEVIIDAPFPIGDKKDGGVETEDDGLRESGGSIPDFLKS